MLWRYLKAQMIVLVCGGLVGPIFLGVYFAIQEPILEWMFWVGLFITVADVLIAIALAVFGAKSSAKTKALEANGVLAFAQVTGITQTAIRIRRSYRGNMDPLVRINLHVEGPGITAFDSQDSVIASWTRLPMITSRKLVALVDPATHDYQIDWNRSALLSIMPAQFNLAEDNRTYDLSGQVVPLMEIMQILKANGVPMSGSIDMRSNPVVRQQVMEVVRRAAAQQQAAAAAPLAPQQPAYAPPAAPEPSTAQRLQELETLRATGAISDAEYTAKREQIISAL
jgi:hypothetical protein